MAVSYNFAGIEQQSFSGSRLYCSTSAGWQNIWRSVPKFYNVYLKIYCTGGYSCFTLLMRCFIDVTSYLNTYHLTAHELAMKIIRDVLNTTGNPLRTAGIGNPTCFLAKVAMDIVAKHIQPDKDGVRNSKIGRDGNSGVQLWNHRPITDFLESGKKAMPGSWRNIECFTMGRHSPLFLWIMRTYFTGCFGINAELLNRPCLGLGTLHNEGNKSIQAQQ